MASDDVVRARNALAGLFSFGRTPTAEVEAAARRNLAAAKIKKHLRETVAAAPRPALSSEQCAEIVGQLLASSEVDGKTARRVVGLVAGGAA